MLNIFNVFKKDNIIKTSSDPGQSVSVHRRNVPFNKEWFNSVYAFNKNSLRFLPAVHDYVFKLLKTHFNTVSEKMETDVTSRKYKKINRSSGHKIWVSTPEIKHFSEKMNITVYVYNRVYNIYKNELELPEFTWGHTLKEVETRPLAIKKVTVKPITLVNAKPANEIIVNKTTGQPLSYSENNIVRNKIIQTSSRLYSTNVNTAIRQKSNTIFLTRKARLLKQEFPTYLGMNKSNINTKYYADMIKWLRLDKLNMVKQHRSVISKLINANNANINSILFFMRLERYDYLINRFTKELAYFKLKQKLIFNQFKFSELYMKPILQFLQSIYKKRVELNIIIIKNYYLNSSILLQIIQTKLRKSKARGRHLSVIDRGTSLIKTPILSSNKLQRLEKINIDMQNVILNNFKMTINNKDTIDQFLLSKNSISEKNIHKLVLKNLENKCISGLFIKVSGRLTKRYKAQRAVSTLRAKGTLQNVYSAHTGSSSVLSRGYNNINVEKAMVHSKNRIGAFGLTGWIASY